MGTYSSDNAMAGIWRAIIIGPADKEDLIEEPANADNSSDIQEDKEKKEEPTSNVTE